MRKQTIWIKDVLKNSVTVDGIDLDCSVDVQITREDISQERTAEYRNYEVEFLDHKEIYICTGQNHTPFLMLDASDFEHEHRKLYNKFIESVNKAAILWATKLPDEQWDEVTDEFP